MRDAACSQADCAYQAFGFTREALYLKTIAREHHDSPGMACRARSNHVGRCGRGIEDHSSSRKGDDRGCEQHRSLGKSGVGVLLAEHWSQGTLVEYLHLVQPSV